MEAAGKKLGASEADSIKFTGIFALDQKNVFAWDGETSLPSPN